LGRIVFGKAIPDLSQHRPQYDNESKDLSNRIRFILLIRCHIRGIPTKTPLQREKSGNDFSASKRALNIA
jgi:hypothetical protein